MENVSGDNAWMLVATAMAMLMTWGLALFYGGLVRQRNALSTMMYVFVAMVVVSLQWTLVGYSLAFGDSFGGLIGNSHYAFLRDVGFLPRDDQNISQLGFMCFQMMFAIITPALVAGAIAERMKLSAFALFAALWSTIVYAPLAHWVWNPEGWLAKLGALDYAGGTVVHISAGFSALVAAWVVGPRLKSADRSAHDLRLAFIGAGLLLVGWFGFNAGSALKADDLAILASVNTYLAAMAAAGAWMIIDRIESGKVTVLGALSGMVAGLVAITPAAGYVQPVAAILIGLTAGWIVCLGIRFTRWLDLDDTLDVFGLHGVAGVVGVLLTGVFATTAMNSNAGVRDGLAYGEHGIGLLLSQSVAVIVSAAWSVGWTYLILRFVKIATGLRVEDEDESRGLDDAIRGEQATSLL